MLAGIGKYKDKSVGALVLKHPDYIAWVISQPNPSGPLARVKAEALRLINIFNSKPINKMCFGSCSKAATRCTVYQRNVHGPLWWCDECNPYQTGAIEGKLSAISTYEEAINHCEFYSAGKDSLLDLIKSLSQAKGLPHRVGEKQIDIFF
jgi:hypothetical protein